MTETEPPPPNHANTHASPRPARVTVVDFDMSFGHLVRFFIKAALAAIPAGIVVAIIYFAMGNMLSGIFNG